LRVSLNNEGFKQLKEMYRWYRLVKDRAYPLSRRQPKGLQSAATYIRRAKVTAAAGEGNTITANLYDSAGIEQTEGEEAGITVYCNIIGETDLNLASPALIEGSEIEVRRITFDNEGTPETRWQCTALFMARVDWEWL
jgi:hypothetical protein